MVERDEFNDLEKRMDQVEKTLVEMQTLIKVLKPVAVLLGMSIGVDVHGLLV